MKPLNIDELTVEQKIGQLLMVRGFIDEEDREFVYKMMENRSVGAIQMPWNLYDYKKEIEEIKKHADYPIIIYSDMENGFPPDGNTIPCAMGLSITNDEEIAYQFGATTAIDAKRNGYNTVGGPVVDLLEGFNLFNVPRSFGSDLDHVSKMTSAVLKGEKDNGVLAIMKHWPIAPDVWRDDHVFDDKSKMTEEDIINSVLVPYVHAMNTVGLDAVMTAHAYYPNVDDTYPATLSDKLIGLLRGAGYDGLLMTDSFAMMGILQNFGEANGYARAIKVGHDMVLPNYRTTFKTAYEYMLESYKNGAFSEERLNEAVRRVIKAQNITMGPASAEKPSDYQKDCIQTVRKESICVIKDDNVSAELDKNSKKLFVLIKENLYRDENSDLALEVPTIGGINDKNISKIKEIILEKFPGADIKIANQYPCAQQVEAVCNASVNAEEIIFVTFSTSGCYTLGGEFTPQLVYLMDAVGAHKLASVIHIGNPYPLEVVPHFPRYLISVGGSEIAIENCLSVLNGEYVPKGKLPFELKLK